MAKSKECTIVEDKGVYSAGEYDITKSMKVLLDYEKQKIWDKINAVIFK